MNARPAIAPPLTGLGRAASLGGLVGTLLPLGLGLLYPFSDGCVGWLCTLVLSYGGVAVPLVGLTGAGLGAFGRYLYVREGLPAVMGLGFLLFLLGVWLLLSARGSHLL